MVKFEALPMLIGIILYYFFFFTVITVIENGSASTKGITNFQTDYNDPNMLGQPDILNQQNKCTGISSLKYDCKAAICQYELNAYYIPCAQFKDAATCLQYENCYWGNISILYFYDYTRCIGNITQHEEEGVNLSFYGFIKSDYVGYTTEDIYTNSSDFCNSGAIGLNDPETCTKFGCTYVNTLNQTMQNFETLGGTGTSLRPTTIWESVKFVTQLKFDFGFSDFVNKIVAFVSFYVVLLALIACIYYMFAPW